MAEFGTRTQPATANFSDLRTIPTKAQKPIGPARQTVAAVVVLLAATIIVPSAIYAIKQSNFERTFSNAMSAPAKVSPCEFGVETSGEVYAVSGRFEPRQQPSDGAAAYVNEKATAALGKTHFQQIDNSVTVRRLCAHGDWSYIQIFDPSSLSGTKGWVPFNLLREIQRDSDGRRLFTEEDFLWNGEMTAHKSYIVSRVNKISAERVGCRNLDPSSVAKSSSKSRPGAPMFYVTCTPRGGLPFNVWFGPKD